MNRMGAAFRGGKGKKEGAMLDEDAEARELAGLAQQDSDPNNKQRKAYMRRRLAKKIALVEKASERAGDWLRHLLMLGGLGIFVTLTVGAVFLEQAESCRFPRHKLDEVFAYKIDTQREDIGIRTRGGKLYWATGPKVQKFHLNMGYGKYRIIADPDPNLDEIVFRVENRAKNKYFLPRMSQLTVKLVNYTNEASNLTEVRADVFLEHETSNTMGGDVSCRRTDVTVVVPSACLLDESKMTVDVRIGDISTRGLQQATFEELTLQNENGQIVAEDINAYKLQLNTSIGSIDVRRATAHIMFVLSQDDGGVISGRDITLYSGDDKKSCRQVVTYVPGFEQYPEVSVECNQEDGELTIDARGAENGGDPAVDLSRVTGGNIFHKVKVGHTRLELMACYDFAGNFSLDAPFGTRTVKMVRKPSETPGLTGFTDPFNKAAAANLLLGSGSGQTQYFQLHGYVNGSLSGSVCCTPACLGEAAYEANPDAVGAYPPGTQTMSLESITTGNLEVLLQYPEVSSVTR